MKHRILAALALACLAAPALADDPTAVTIPVGSYIGDTLGAVVTAVVPIVSFFVIKALRQVAPWASLLFSQQRIEMMVQNGLNYGLNAIDGATKGKTLTIPVGSAVLAKAVQYVLDTAPAKVIAAAGGASGIAEKVFRLMHLEEGATAANVLAPVQVVLPGKR